MASETLVGGYGITDACYNFKKMIYKKSIGIGDGSTTITTVSLVGIAIELLEFCYSLLDIRRSSDFGKRIHFLVGDIEDERGDITVGVKEPKTSQRCFIVKYRHKM